MDIQDYIESGIIESYVLGLANAEEAAELELIMQENAAVKEAVNNFSEVVERNALQYTVAPPAGLREKIMQELFKGQNNQQPSPASVISLTNAEKNSFTPVTKLNAWKRVAAVAVLLLAVSAVMNIYFYKNYQAITTEYHALVAERTNMQAGINVLQTRLKYIDTGMHTINNPETKRVKMSGLPGHETSIATVYWDTQSKNVYIAADKLPKAPAGSQYQLWAIVNGKPVDAGLVTDCAAGLCRMKNISSAQAFAITLEKTGGSPAPSMDKMYTMGNV